MTGKMVDYITWWREPTTVFKITQNVPLEFLNCGNFCPFKSDLSGNTVCLQASGCQNSQKMDLFGTFNELLSTFNCKRSSLRSQCWMLLFGRFSNTVLSLLQAWNFGRKKCWKIKKKIRARFTGRFFFQKKFVHFLTNAHERWIVRGAACPH